jgi:uncharacterized repeat protein (TIGR03803 family)
MKQALLCAVLVILGCGFALGQAQYKVLYNFGTNGGAADGNGPNEGLVHDRSGNLYGTTWTGGTAGFECYQGCGTVFELSPALNGAWTETVIYSFCTSTGDPNTCPEGAYPASGLTIDDAGNLYGITNAGDPVGVVFQLSPPTVSGGSWTETVLASIIATGLPTLDATGNLYGTAPTSGQYRLGAVFELSPPSVPGGAWTETLLYSFCPSGNSFDCPGGWAPQQGVVFDRSGNLYGATEGGEGLGPGFVVYELSPGLSGQWTETVLRDFKSQYHGFSRLSFDPSGNLYGTVPSGGVTNRQYCEQSCGSVARLLKNANWRPQILEFDGENGGRPFSGLIIDTSTGIAYGTTELGGTRMEGTVFQVKGETESVVYSFCSEADCADGSLPGTGGSLMLVSGKLYGTTGEGGSFDQGVVFEVTP